MSVSAANTDRVIMACASQFVKYIKETHNIDVEGVDLSHFIAIYQKKRAFKPNRDTILNIYEFLYRDEIIIFSTICSEYLRDFYPYAWNIIHRHRFPMSIARSLNHVETQTAVSLDLFYGTFAYHRLRNHDWFLIFDSEKNMAQYEVLMRSVAEDPYDNNMLVYKAQFARYRFIRDNAISRADSILIDFLRAFQFNSKIDIYGNKYYTIKPDIDTRVYGIDPIKDPVKSYIKMQWLKGCYHDQIEHNYNPTDIGNGDFTYGIDSYGTPFRQRKRPSYC